MATSLMKYLISDPSTIETRPPNLYRYTGAGRDAERWDPATRSWVALSPPWVAGAPNRENVIEAEIDRGSYGMRTPSLSEVLSITGADHQAVMGSEWLGQKAALRKAGRFSVARPADRL
jgi:hypothetical protein